MANKITNDTTDFGFNFGSMKITRVCSEKLTAIIRVKTAKAEFTVRATKNGSVRIFDNQGNECEIVSKDCMSRLIPCN